LRHHGAREYRRSRAKFKSTKRFERGNARWKSNRDWENACIVAGSFVSNRRARMAAKAYLQKQLGLPLTDFETKRLPVELRSAGAYQS
jgi:hypothetical protein